jgi:hypothetical protein
MPTTARVIGQSRNSNDCTRSVQESNGFSSLRLAFERKQVPRFIGTLVVKVTGGVIGAGRMLCKQGAAGSSPTTSTNHIQFNNMALPFALHNPCYRSRCSRVSCQQPVVLKPTTNACPGCTWIRRRSRQFAFRLPWRETREDGHILIEQPEKMDPT